MIDRRRLLGAAAILPALGFASSSAFACRAAAPKDRRGYTNLIDRLFDAWWRRDLAAVRACCSHAEVERPFDPHSLFTEFFVQPEAGRYRGEILFNGSSSVAQIITPSPADPPAGICGGMAHGVLFAVNFWPGVATPVIERVAFVAHSVLAEGEWSPRS